MGKFYITIAIPYVNGKPHLGHALEYFQADTIRRFHEINGDQTLLLSGADENALKNVQAAEKEGISTKEFLDRNSKVFREAFQKLGVKLDVFQRGSDQQKHWPGVQKLWRLCFDNGDIYKKSYEGLYCVGCESFKTAEELNEEGLCKDHLKKPELIKEENYFFRLNKYQQKLIDLIESNTLHIIPNNKRQEALGFIKQGLEDFSISRSTDRAKGVGVPVPNNPEQVMYVWFDALTIYMTGVGFGSDETEFKTWWPADLHIIGKDINRFHTVYWPAMLLSAGLSLPKQVLIHSFINAPGGVKMSKSLGNAIDPFEIAQEYGLESLRYYLLSQISLDEDGEMSLERFKEVYNADLANGLGNLVSRVAKLCEISKHEQLARSERFINHMIGIDPYLQAMQNYKINEACGFIWQKVAALDKYIVEVKPWDLIKTEDPRLHSILTQLVVSLQEIGILLSPILPETSRKIEQIFKGSEIKSGVSLFPRLKKDNS